MADLQRPNILYFYVDDMGWGAIGPNGQAERKAKGLPHVLTPNIDRLAAEGVNFKRAYGCTVCSPARSSQQTGFHQGHTFADRNDPDNAKKAIRAEDITMGDVLTGAGYATGYWGKWGYGGSKSQPDPEILNVQTLPTSHGYQHVLAELHHVRAHTFFQPTLWKAPAASGAKGGLELVPNSMEPYRRKSQYPESPALQNHPKYPKTAYCDDAYCFAALDFARSNAKRYQKSGEPFFGLLAVQVPHAPFDEVEALPEWDKAYRGLPFFKDLSRQAQQWAAMVTRIDAHFGNILDALEDPNGDGDKSDSVAANTLVVFQSDNGGPQHPARKEFVANGGLRGNKGQIWEGGIRVPTVMRWPAAQADSKTLPVGSHCDQVIDVTDLLPTFCELAGAEIPVGIDGVSLAPWFTGEGTKRERDFVIHETGRDQSIIHGDMKLIRQRSGFVLYDLANDPAESTDLSGTKATKVDELKELLLAERVAEPKGFANTYHHWTGSDASKMSDPDSWSDYDYSNEGISYLKDSGAPQISWIATIRNPDSKPSTLKLDKDLEFLGLEIGSGKGLQTVAVGKAKTLTGRNEIRLSKNGQLRLRGGTLHSLRSVEVQDGSVLRGSGRVDASVSNEGELRLEGAIAIKGDYSMTGSSKLIAGLGSKATPHLKVAGTAVLNGALKLERAGQIQKGKEITLVEAKRIVGKFQTKGDVISVSGKSFKVRYHTDHVTLKAL